MCTVTVYQDEATLLVTMNRDEARSRGPEIPPRMHREACSTTWVAPHDSDRGGSWFAVNNRGVIACLLNRYQGDNTPTPPSETFESRGAIIPALMTGAGPAEGLAGINRSLSAYPPFTLVVASPGICFRADWNGAGALEQRPFGGPWDLVSSSFFEPDSVLPWRQEAFEAWVGEGAPFERDIPAIHLYRPPGRGDMAPLMTRDVSSTRSITQARVDRVHGRCTLRYAPVDDGTLDWKQWAVIHNLPRAPFGGVPAPPPDSG